MIRCQITRGFVLLMLISLVGSACGPTPTPEVISEVVKETVVVVKEVVVTQTPVELLSIPLSLNPAETVLNRGDQVVISVIPEKWQAVELTWKLDSDSEELRSPDALSASTGPIVMYTAPAEGKVIVSVRGQTAEGVGRGSVSFTIEPTPLGGVVEFWTFPEMGDPDSERANEFLDVYPDVLVKIVSFPPKDTRDKLSAALAAGKSPDAIRFFEISDAQAFGEKGHLDTDVAERIIREIGKDRFDAVSLRALRDPTDKTRWIAVPTEQGALGILIGAENKTVAEAWVKFLIQAAPTAIPAPTPSPTPHCVPQLMGNGTEYIVTSGDTLKSLADKYLGVPQSYLAITYYTNLKAAEDESYAKITDPNLIEVDWKIYIPSVEEAEAYFECQ